MSLKGNFLVGLIYRLLRPTNKKSGKHWQQFQRIFKRKHSQHKAYTIPLIFVCLKLMTNKISLMNQTDLSESWTQGRSDSNCFCHFGDWWSSSLLPFNHKSMLIPNASRNDDDICSFRENLGKTGIRSVCSLLVMLRERKSMRSVIS